MSQWPLYILIWLLLPCGIRHPGYQCACVTRDYKSYMSLCGNLYTHIYFSFIKRSLVAGVAEWKLAFSAVPYCKRKHTKCEGFPKCCSHLPAFWYSTVLCLSVVLAWKVSGQVILYANMARSTHGHWSGCGAGLSSILGFPFSSSSSLIAWICSEGCCKGAESRDLFSRPAKPCSSSITFFHIMWFCRRCWVIWQ